MKANTVRLGNWFINPEGKHERVYISGETERGRPTINWWAEETCNPIPITEDILLKAGFEKWNEAGLLVKDAWSPGHPSQRFDLSWSEKTGMLCKSRYQAESDTLRMEHITSLHSLMNLYFALTGEELTIDL